ncbi:hypothetical protein ARMGADRAFT_1036605 [Armillaria gallica]|uniref:Uncharacterized protein n=1 Tax=Armillaria gallica TaxID=47427 RepID=A0A2H3CPW4_ARMGA|nr:hypothetical protein ARMGADRAFT_1036605 [Armillaria gallica]
MKEVWCSIVRCTFWGRRASWVAQRMTTLGEGASVVAGNKVVEKLQLSISTGKGEWLILVIGCQRPNHHPALLPAPSSPFQHPAVETAATIAFPSVKDRGGALMTLHVFPMIVVVVLWVTVVVVIGIRSISHLLLPDGSQLLMLHRSHGHWHLQIHCAWVIGPDIDMGSSGSLDGDGAHPHVVVRWRGSLFPSLRIVLMLDIA